MSSAKFNAGDVLLGRGNGTNHHPGNKEFRILIQKRKQAYADAKPGQKGLISKQVLNAIHDKNGRFLEKVRGHYHEVTEKKALTKISQALREIPKTKEPSVPSSSYMDADMAATVSPVVGTIPGGVKSIVSSPGTPILIQAETPSKIDMKHLSKGKNASAAAEELLGPSRQPSDMKSMFNLVPQQQIQQQRANRKLSKSSSQIPTHNINEISQRRASLPKRWQQKFVKQSSRVKNTLDGGYDPNDSISAFALPNASVNFNPQEINWNTSNLPPLPSPKLPIHNGANTTKATISPGVDIMKNANDLATRKNFLRSQQSIDVERDRQAKKKNKRPAKVQRDTTLSMEDGMKILNSTSRVMASMDLEDQQKMQQQVISSSDNLLSHLLVSDTNDLNIGRNSNDDDNDHQPLPTDTPLDVYVNADDPEAFQKLVEMVSSANGMKLDDESLKSMCLSLKDTGTLMEAHKKSYNGNAVGGGEDYNAKSPPNNIDPVMANMSALLDSVLTFDCSEKSHQIGAQQNKSYRSLGQDTNTFLVAEEKGGSNTNSNRVDKPDNGTNGENTMNQILGIPL